MRPFGSLRSLRVFGPLSALILVSGILRAEEIRIAVLGDFPENKGLETRAAQFAVDAANQGETRRHEKVKLVPVHDKGTVEGALDAAKHIVEQDGVLGVVVHGEAGADPGVLKVFRDADLAVVSASSWASPRSTTAGVTWLSPSGEQLAEVAATYARKGARKAKQVAVLDNGAPTSQAYARAFERRFKELGGRVDVSETWISSSENPAQAAAVSKTVKSLKANWPEFIFYAGDGKEAGLLMKTLRSEGAALKETQLLGLPSLTEPEFFNTTRNDAEKRSFLIFPCPDYTRGGRLAKNIGVTFPKGGAADKAYVSYGNRPGRWASMVFDGAQLMLDALERAAGSSGGVAAASPETPTAMTETAQSKPAAGP